MILQSKEIVYNLQKEGVKIIKKYISTPIEALQADDITDIFVYLRQLFLVALIGSRRYNDYIFLSNDIVNNVEKLKYFSNFHTKKEIQLFLENY